MKIKLAKVVTYLNADNARPGAYNILGVIESDYGIGVALQLRNKDGDWILTLNRTNAESLIGGLGDETDAWIGKYIDLRIVQTVFKGRRVPAIRVSPSLKDDDIPF